MSKIGTIDLWEPTVLGRGKLNDRWSAYLVEAPFDMPADASAIVGTRVALDGGAFKVGGMVANSPPRPISLSGVRKRLCGFNPRRFH